MSDMKREFKDLVRFEHYDYLNSEIKGDYDKAHAVKCVNGTFVGTEDPNVLVIAGPGDWRIEKGLLSDQYKAVAPLVDYYQFIDNYFTPHYMEEILAARK